jgi:3-oxoacyl-[acyl-carrier-protein] synthase II
VIQPSADRRTARPPIAVVGAGVKAPGGLTTDELWASLCQGRPTAERYVDGRLPSGTLVLVSRAAGFDASVYLSPIERRRLDRTHQLGIAAAQDAIAMCGPDLPSLDRCAVVSGVGLGASALMEQQYERLFAAGSKALAPLAIPMFMPNALTALLSIRFGFRGPAVTVCSACASGAAAIAEGVELLRRSAADLVLAGGADSLLTYSALAGFLPLDAMSRRTHDPATASRPFDRDRDGFVMGEGAGFVVLQRADDAAADGRRVLGFIRGHASTSDAFHLVAPAADGAGALACMKAALSDAGVDTHDIGHVNAHGTSTTLGDRAEALALAALFTGQPPPVTAVKGSTGHLIAGAGAVEAIVTLKSLELGLVPPTAGTTHVDPDFDLDVVLGQPRPVDDGFALSNAFGFGGMNTVLVMSSR